MQSAPGSPQITITFAVKGAFTATMAQLKVGDEVWLKLPYGDLFTQPHRKEKTVFVAGGTGITPFLSLFSDAAFADYTAPKVYLGLRSVAYHIYHRELDHLLPDTLRIVYEDQEGRMDGHTLVAENGTDASYFISGPPAMIRSLKTSLQQEGVSAENILTDDWE